MIHPRNSDTNRYPLFESFFKNISNNTILDFGGSSGNLLYFSNGNINPSMYTCIDIVNDAIIKGQQEFPMSTFLHYDKYNQMYNVNGNVQEPFPKIKQQDYIWGYSVFSHMILEDIVSTLLWMKSLNPKKIVMSYLNNDNDDFSKRTLNYFYEKRIQQFKTCIDFRKNNDNYFYLTDNYYGNKSGSAFISIYKTEWLFKKLKNYGINAKKINLDITPVSFMEIE